MDTSKLLKELRKDKKLVDTGVGVSFAVETPPVSYISTGCLALDWCAAGSIREGGLPVGRVVELFGDPSAGKSLLLSHIFAETQKKGGIAILDDTEGSHDPDFMSMLGVKVEDLIILDAANDMGQKTIEAHIKAVHSLTTKIREKGFTGPITVGLDSIASITTEHELVAGLDKEDMARAKRVRKVLRMYAPTFSKMGILYVLTNHTISTMAATKYEKQVTTPGGGSPKFWASLRIYVRARKFFRDIHNQHIGCEVVAKIEKTKMTVPFRECVLRLNYTEGLDRLSGLFEVLEIMGEIKSPSNGWYTYKNKDKKRRADIEKLIAKEYGAGKDVHLDGAELVDVDEVSGEDDV